MAGILDGIKVIDAGHWVAIPAAAAVLGDWGADVIKIEPVTGDTMHGTPDQFAIVNGTRLSMGQQVVNRNKRSMTLNLKLEKGKAIFNKLAAKSDVLLTNFQVKTLGSLMMDYETVRKCNPRIIYALVTGFGTRGPDKDERAFDFAARARAGLNHFKNPAMIDLSTGNNVVAAIMGALFYREKTGEGQMVELSLYHTLTWASSIDLQPALMGIPGQQIDRVQASNPLAAAYITGDKREIRLQMVQSELQWPNFCRAIGMTELEYEPRFANSTKRAENCEELVKIIEKVFSAYTLATWKKKLQEQDCIFGVVQTHDEVAKDPQAWANDFFIEFKHPAGPVKMVTTPVTFPQHPASIRRPPPESGQHTEEILLELGYGWHDITAFKEEGVIA